AAPKERHQPVCKNLHFRGIYGIYIIRKYLQSHIHPKGGPVMTAVIYARYSSDNQREESIEGQIRECTAYAEKNGMTVVKHYIDRAYSAKTANRPEFQ